MHYQTMTKSTHFVKATKFTDPTKDSSLAPTHVKVSSLAPTWGMCDEFMGKWNFEQCFLKGNQGRKS
jgi:hypothetical protein